MTSFNWETTKRKSFNKVSFLIKYGWIGKILASILVFIGMTIPIDLFILAKWFFVPEGFWQNIVLFSIWAILIGWLQIILGIMGFVLILGIITGEIY